MITEFSEGARRVSFLCASRSKYWKKKKKKKKMEIKRATHRGLIRCVAVNKAPRSTQIPATMI